MKVFYCQHTIETDANGESHAPYIYAHGGVGKPHYCVRINRKGYIFLIPDDNVPAWFSGDSNVRDLGDLTRIDKPKIADKTILSEALGVTALTNETFSDLWSRILKRTFSNRVVDLAVMLQHIQNGEKHYIDVSAT